MNYKISKLARDLNVGVNTAVEFLRKHNINVDADPNARVGEEAAQLLQKEFSNFKSDKDASQAIHPQRPKDSKKSRERQRSEEPRERHAGPRIVGHVDLDAKGNVIRKPAPAPKADPTPAEHAEPVVKDTSAAPGPAAAPETPAQPAPQAQAAPAPQVKNETKPQEKAEARPEVKPEAPASAAEPAKPADERPAVDIYRVAAKPDAPQLKVLGTIDLSALEPSGRKRRRDRRKSGAGAGTGQQTTGQQGDSQQGDRRKRTRINSEKVDVAKAASQGADHRGDGQNRGGQNRGGQQGGQQGGRGRNGSRGGQQNRGGQQGGRGQQNRGGQQRPEVSSEDVQKQVKETLARLSNKQTKKSVKWRKEKREEMHNRELARARRDEAESKIIKITEFVTANDLANLMEIPVNSIIAACMKLGVMVSINQRLDAETINIVAEEFGFSTEYVSAEVSEAIATEEDKEEDLVPRPPIVTVMGHVDHGKTSLLDYIRKANVIAGEAGGITQHIGAYNVKLSDGRHITFLDTPGHEAFTAMRARGAKVTDLAIIIVAADDNVMPQTVEAINHASAAGVPMVFAINKIDKPTANPDKIKEELANMNYLVEEWGGKYQSQDISAKKGLGVEDLMEKVLLEAEMLDLKANPDRLAMGSVIESSLDKGRGYVATVLVQNGTLRVGDVILAGTHYGKVKAMFNERNQRVQEAGPATPVLILGLNGAPTAGDTFNVLPTEQEAREIAGKREQLQRELGLRTKKRPGLEELGRRRALDDFHELNLVVKGDVDGSIEALSDSLIKLSTPEIQVNVLHKGVGAISESDVTLAAASDAIIIGFQVRPSAAARREAEKEGVEIRLYSVIYKAIEEVKDAMEGLLSPEIREEVTGNVEVLQTYHISKVGTIAGAIVRDGKIKSKSKVRVIRDGIVRYTGELGSLKRFKDDVKEVVSGYDCGLSVHGYNDICEGDIIEAFEEVEVKKTLK